jgi:UDP-N-acetylmuramoylalanine--D-glutamate ligase
MNEAHRYPAGSVFRTLEDIREKKITVMGIGLNGGGEESIRFFLKHGAFVTATDTKTEEALLPTIHALQNDPQLDSSRLRFVLGKHDKADFANADAVIKNPVVKYEGNEFLNSARAVETDLSVFLALTKAPIIAVTGSKGKSTTVSAIHYGLQQASFTAFLGGNITVSPLTFLEKTTKDTPVVIEFSSWQLRDLRGRGVLKPKIAIITTIVRDHQNWYGNMQDYIADKKLIYADQDAADFTICAKDSWGDEFASETKAHIVRYDAQAILHGAKTNLVGELLIPGGHNRLNVHNAALALDIMGVSPEKIKTIFSSWRGIAHRLEFFHRWNAASDSGKNFRAAPVLFYNDTAATVPEASAAASQAFEKPVHLIAGGNDKELDFTVLADALSGTHGSIRPASIYLLAGNGTDKLVPLLRAHNVLFSGPFDSLENLLCEVKVMLIKNAHENSAETERIVVFSPGATSFGMFKNEFDRGDTFKLQVQKIFA